MSSYAIIPALDRVLVAARSAISCRQTIGHAWLLITALQVTEGVVKRVLIVDLGRAPAFAIRDMSSHSMDISVML